jgi:hypothetical protein
MKEDLRAPTPLFYVHANPFCLFRLNLDEHLPLEDGIREADEQRSGDSIMIVSEIRAGCEFNG